MFDNIPHVDIRIMGVDPGTDCYGLAFLRIDADANIHVDEAYTISAIKDLSRSQTMKNHVEEHGSRLVRIAHLADQTIQEVTRFQPDRFYYESPFFSRKTVGSFEALTQMMTCAQLLLYRLHNRTPLEKITPQEGKSAVLVTGKGSQKDLVAKRLFQLPGVYFNVDINELDEHAVDAIVVAIAGIRKNLDLW